MLSVLMQIKDVGGLLTDVKKRGCFRTQFLKKFGAYQILPYLCIVNQIKLMTKDNK